MNLIELFSNLSQPASSSQISAITITEFPFAKIGVNSQNFPVLLVDLLPDTKSFPLKNIRLKHIELTHNVECKIIESGKPSFNIFTVIVLKSHEEKFVQYFLQISETFIRSLSRKPTTKELLTIFKSFIEIFRVMSMQPTKTVQGLWAELLIITTARTPEMLLSYWHNLPDEKFDFNADTEKLEVKSSSALERVHTFAAEQLSVPVDKNVLIASVFTKQTPSGSSVMDLARAISKRIKEDYSIRKMYSIISQTLGCDADQAIEIKFDFELGKSSIRFYRHQDIEKIEKIHIPNNVKDVRFKSDLSPCDSIEPSNLKGAGALFSSL